MKIKLLLILIVIGLLSCHLDAGNQTRKDDLKNVLASYYEAMAKKDLQKMNTLTTSNFVMYDEGTIYNNESAVRSVEQLPPFTATFAFDSINANIDKINASAYYLRKADFTMGDGGHMPMRFLESATFRKEDGKWKLRFLQSSVRK
jgi:SnoaL-like domain